MIKLFPALPGIAIALSVVATADASPPVVTGPVDTPPVVSAPGKEFAGEKLIFLFHHRADWSREHFQLHYIESHAPLGMTWTRNMLGYTVNLVESPNWTDAMTEQWVPSAMDMLDPSNSYASSEDFDHVAADRIGDGQTRYYVVKETVLKGAPLFTPPVLPTPGVKVIWSYKDASQLPPIPRGATRVVDNVVTRKLVNGIGADGQAVWKEKPSDIAVFRMAWAESPDALDVPGLSADAMLVAEYRFRVYVPGRKAED